MSNTLANYRTKGGATVTITADIDQYHQAWEADTRAKCQGCADSTNDRDEFIWSPPTPTDILTADGGGKVKRWAEAHAAKCTALPR